MTTKQVLLPFSKTSVSVRVHPVALFAICDAFLRRNKDQERVIGTLLGSIVDGVYEVKNCFVVPHTETGDQVSSAGGRRARGGHSVRLPHNR
jgi:translation initiation factor 3 subunit F